MSLTDASPEDPTATWIAKWRRISAWLGVAFLVALADFGSLGGRSLLADAAVASLAIAISTAWLEVFQNRKTLIKLKRPESPIPQGAAEALLGDRIPIAILIVVTTACVQAWYLPHTAIAGGDLAPPNGTAWLSRIFSPWTWSGSDLGHPGGLESQLPWGALLWFVHLLGGSANLAQRVWITLLMLLCATGSYVLLRLLNFTTITAVVGALFYVFNPFMLSTVGTNPVFLAAMALMVLDGSTVIAVASGRINPKRGIFLLVTSIPLTGYAYENPPLLIVLGVALLLVAAVGAALHAKSGRRNITRLLSAAIPLMAAASLYWLIPSLQAIQSTNLTQFSSPNGWIWTEVRSNLANALWLNTSWTWHFAGYIPYAQNYRTFPLVILKYTFPIVAFSSLALKPLPQAGTKRLIVSAAFGTLSLATIFFSTGTNLPGAVLFNPIYDLPYGWLVLGPGRFLMLAVLGYTMMTAVTTERVLSVVCAHAHRTVIRKHLYRGNAQWMLRALRDTATMVIALTATLAINYPMATGAVTATYAGRTTYSSHVSVPGYWRTMVSYINKTQSKQNILVFPTDPFYQVGYTWHYYGNDAFITDMSKAHIIDPAGQGYTSASPQLLRLTTLIADNLSAGHIRLANRLLWSIGVADILIRGDVIASQSSGPVGSANSIATALRHDSAYGLIKTDGPLMLYGIRPGHKLLNGLRHNVPYVTVNSGMPHLQNLGVFRSRRVLVTHEPILGVPAVLEIPNLPNWSATQHQLEYTMSLPKGWTPTVVLQQGEGSAGTANVQTSLHAGRTTPVGPFAVKDRVGPRASHVTVVLPKGRELLPSAAARGTAWGPVGNCNNTGGKQQQYQIGQRTIRVAGSHGGSVLELFARSDKACVSQRLAWKRGTVLISLKARSIVGSAPQVCVWEVGPNHCAPVHFVMHRTAAWTSYQAILTPSRTTKALALFLYATSSGQGKMSVDEYQSVSVTQAQASSSPVVVLRPSPPGTIRHVPYLTTLDATYGNSWDVSGAASKVVVDGLSEGWLATPTKRVQPTDTLLTMEHFAFTVSATAGLIALVFLVRSFRVRARAGR